MPAGAGAGGAITEDAFFVARKISPPLPPRRGLAGLIDELGARGRGRQGGGRKERATVTRGC